MPINEPPSFKIMLDLHGLTLTFQTSDPLLGERFATIYGHLPSPDSPTTGVVINWQLDSSAAQAPFPPEEVIPISSDGLVHYYQRDDTIFIRMPKYGLISVDLSNNILNGLVTPNTLEVYGAFEDVMMIALAPLYRRRGWFALHAFAGLAPNGKVALITGEMGAGKTTTGLALLNAGWKLLSNDSPLLTIRRKKVQVLAYPGRLSAFDDSLARFEALKRFRGTKTKATKGRQKRIFRAEEAFDQPWAMEGPAGGIFFPQVVAELEQSELIEVLASEAILQLIPQAIEGWDKSTIGQNLALLRQLVEQVPCYHLRLSPHVEQLPPLLQTGLEGVVPNCVSA